MLKLNESQSVRLLEALPEALLITSLTGEIVFFNKAAEQLTGYDQFEVLGEDVTLLMPQSERRRIDVMTWLGRWANNPDAEQLRYLYLDGLTKACAKKLYRVRVSLFQNGEDQYFTIVIRDVTEDHESTVKLRHAQLINNRIMAIGEDAILSVDETLVICFWNRKAKEVFGYEEEEVIGKHLSLLIPHPFKASHDVDVKQFAGSDLPSKLMGERGEIQGLHKDGKVIPLEAAITKTYIDDKLILSAQVRDISARQQMEKALKDSEARFRAVFENAFEAIALLSPDGNLLELNAAAENLLPVNQGIGNKKFWELDWWPSLKAGGELDDARQNLKENIEKASRGETLRMVVELQPVSGITRKIDFSLIPVKDESGETMHLIAEGRDLTLLDS